MIIKRGKEVKWRWQRIRTCFSLLVRWKACQLFCDGLNPHPGGHVMFEKPHWDTTFSSLETTLQNISVFIAIYYKRGLRFLLSNFYLIWFFKIVPVIRYQGNIHMNIVISKAIDVCILCDLCLRGRPFSRWLMDALKWLFLITGWKVLGPLFISR